MNKNTPQTPNTQHATRNTQHDDVIAALLATPMDPRTFEHHARLLKIYAPLAARLLRTYRNQDRRAPTSAQEFERAIDYVLDELPQPKELEL